MKVTESTLPGVLILDPTVISDNRGFFFESWNARLFREATGVEIAFVQDNHSRSVAGVVRGIHYQLPDPQGKLVRCIAGRVWDVAVDLRRSSPTFADWFGIELNETNKTQLWVPEGFGHGFVALSDGAELLYKTTEFFVAEHDRVVAWDDSEIGIDWPLDREPSLSAKDAAAPSLAEAVLFE